MLLGDRKYQNPQEFTTALLEMTSMALGRQQDANEFITMFLEHMHEVYQGLLRGSGCLKLYRPWLLWTFYAGPS